MKKMIKKDMFIEVLEILREKEILDFEVHNNNTIIIEGNYDGYTDVDKFCFNKEGFLITTSEIEEMKRELSELEERKEELERQLDQLLDNDYYF